MPSRYVIHAQSCLFDSKRSQVSQSKTKIYKKQAVKKKSWSKAIRVAAFCSEWVMDMAWPDTKAKPIHEFMNASPTVPPCYHISLTAKEFLHFQHPKLLMSSVATSSMYVCTTAGLVHPLKLGIDQEKTSWKENQGPKRTASGWPTDFESDWEEVILLNDGVKAHTSTY